MFSFKHEGERNMKFEVIGYQNWPARNVNVLQKEGE